MKVGNKIVYSSEIFTNPNIMIFILNKISSFHKFCQALKHFPLLDLAQLNKFLVVPGKESSKFCFLFLRPLMLCLKFSFFSRHLLSDNEWTIHLIDLMCYYALAFVAVKYDAHVFK